jgi:hypothetical protein
MKKIIMIPVLFVLVLITFSITCRVFDSSFADATIDWFAFLAGIFLVVEGTYRFFRSASKTRPEQAARLFRMIIGTCVFTIHLLQFMRK